MGVRDTPNRCTYLGHLFAFSRFGSRINSLGDLVWESGATPHRCTYLRFQRPVGLGQSHLTLDQSQIALNKLFHVEQSTRQLHQSRKIWFTWIKARLPGTRGLLLMFGTMGTMSPGLGRKEQGGLEAHN
jgi:hypothetical protein